MTASDWEKYIRSLAKVSRPDDMELRMLADLSASEKERDQAKEKLRLASIAETYWWEKSKAAEALLREARNALSRLANIDIEHFAHRKNYHILWQSNATLLLLGDVRTARALLARIEEVIHG